ncbi:hypothetical protein RFI_13911 [Reticulomyxa filosa]|uniref:Cation-transporting P-type ATPase N-terminal domain-containing protein n=1 Tax=Reticulomyxa filosa TaxID=46433 RepID=X6ND66_RETFI|nr:hypothetical protein RFI_13911 [Reticulomyxa filosa]|eukprot:ETO23272.1 hypothetical protein RFI_13911 [Reticulomyxa filosa]
MEDAYLRNAQEVLQFFSTDPKTGLTSAQAQKNRLKHGLKRGEEAECDKIVHVFVGIELPAPPKVSWLSLIAKQFQDLLVLILLGAAVVSFVLSCFEENKSYLETLIEPVVIFLILICNAVVGVWQESSAEEAIHKLKEFEAKTAIVVRDGKTQKVDRGVLVPGDVVLLSVGEKVPADCRILDMHSRTVQVDQSMLTGESRSISKSLDPVPEPKRNVEIVDQDKHCMLFSVFQKKKNYDGTFNI